MERCLVAGCDGEVETARTGQIRWAGMANYPVKVGVCATHRRLLATGSLTIRFDDAQPAPVDHDSPSV